MTVGVNIADNIKVLIEENKDVIDEISGNLMLGKDNDQEMDAIFFTYKDSAGEEHISSVFVDFWTENANGIIFPHSTALTDKWCD